MLALKTLTRRTSVGTVAALVASAATAAPAFAQSATPTPSARDAARAAAVTQSNSLRTMRNFQMAIDVLKPYEGDNNFDVMIAMGQAIEGFWTPVDRLKAVEWYTKAIAVSPNNKTGYTRRAGAYGDAGFRWFEERLEDRRKAVALSETASPTKTATAGEYGDLAGAEDAFTVSRFGTFNPSARDTVMELRSKAIAVEETAGRLLDRAELINSRHSNASQGRADVDRAGIIASQGDPNAPATWYNIAQWARRTAALPTAMTLAGITISVNGITTPYRANVSQLRNQAIEYYSKYINAFEASNRDYSKFGDGIGAYENRAATYRNMGGSFHRKAIKDQETLLAINPRNANYWRNIGVSLDALREGVAAKPFYQKYVELNGPEDLGEVGSSKARLAQ
jgi:tetratricopeptide (TPR) repeat protein